MKLEGLSAAATLELSWAAKANPLRNPEQLERLLKVLDSMGPLRPTVAMAKFKGPFDVAKLKAKLLRSAAERFVSLVLRNDAPELEYSFFVNAEFEALSLRARFPLALFCDDIVCGRIVSFARELASVVGVQFGRAHDEADTELSDAHRGSPLTVPAEIDDVYWLTVWGADLVERAGRDRVLAAPAHRIEQLAGGAVLVLTSATPGEALTPAGRRAQARALAHLRPERTEEAIFATLVQRSAHLAPVEKRLDADVAPLLELIINDSAKAERERETARLNAFRPPAVTELRESPLPADVDAEDALDDYDDRAEQLIALLHKQVANIESFEPAVVPRVDYWVWRYNYAGYDRNDVETDLIPAFGAYLALVMIKHLDGELVPRRKLDESQVVIGGRAYLPFLRARHALASRDAALDYSMTQFIAVAKRGG